MSLRAEEVVVVVAVAPLLDANPKGATALTGPVVVVVDSVVLDDVAPPTLLEAAAASGCCTSHQNMDNKIIR